MFREQYKLDNKSITPREELLAELAKKMQAELEKEPVCWKQKFYLKPAFITSLVACCLAVVIFSAYQLPTMQQLVLQNNTSSNQVNLGSAYQASFVNRALDNNLLLPQETQGKVVDSKWNPLSDNAKSVMTLPVYRYLSVDQKAKAKEVTKLFDLKMEATASEGEFTCKTKENVEYNLSVQPTGSYTMKPLQAMISEEAVTKEAYEKNVNAFLKKYAASLNLKNYRVEYTTTITDGVEYATGTYILNNYSDSPAQALLGYSENISLELFENGEIRSLNNRQTKKEVVGEFNLMGVEQAIEYYNSGNAYTNNSEYAKGFNQENTIRIEYIADASKGVLQPIYIITEKITASVETISAVPAIDGQVWTADNIPTLPEKKDPAKTPEQYTKTLLDFPQINFTNTPSNKLYPLVGNDQVSTVLPVYSLSKDIIEKTQEVKNIFGLKEKTSTDVSNVKPNKSLSLINEADQPFEFTAYQNGSYSLVAAKKASFFEKTVYEKAVNNFIEKYGEKLNIVNPVVEYLHPYTNVSDNFSKMKSGVEYTRGVYIFNHYNDAAAKSLLGYAEYIYLELSSSGEIERLENHQMQKQKVGEYPLLTKEQALKQFLDGKAYYVTGCAPDPKRARGNVSLMYIADKDQTVLQPVYMIELLSTMTHESRVGEVIGYAAVPAIDGELWTSQNSKMMMNNSPDLTCVPDRYTTNFFDYSAGDTTEPTAPISFNYTISEADSLSASIYQYNSIDQKEKAAEIVQQFVLKETATDKGSNFISKGEGHTLTVRPNGQYDLYMTKQERGDLTPQQYESFTTAFLAANQKFLGLTNPTIKYDSLTAKDGKTQIVVGVYLFDNYQDGGVNSSLGIREYVKLSFNNKGELAVLINKKTDKDLVGAYAILSKSQAIKQFKEGKAFRVQTQGAIPPEPNSAVGDVILLHVADAKKTILQPVYFIELLASTQTDAKKGEVIGYAAVPAINGKVMSMTNLSKESCINLKDMLEQYDKLCADKDANAQRLKDLQKEIDRLINL